MFKKNLITRTLRNAALVGLVGSLAYPVLAQETPVDEESVEKINADITLVKSDPLDFEVSTNGVFDRWDAHFADSLSNINWTFYINPNISSASIPIMPSSVYAEYPELSSAYFIMTSISAVDYLCVDSYQEWLELYFSTDGYQGDFCHKTRYVWY